MSDNEGPKAKSSWSDKERATPRPAGRSVIACQRMMDRLKGTLKNELEALKSGNPIEEGTPKKVAGTPKSTPRKRKAKDAEDGEVSPTKRPRKKKGAVAEEPADGEE